MLYIIFLVLLVIGLLVVIFVYAFTYTDINFENNSMILEIENNLKAKFIYSFKEKSDCSSDEETLILGQWDGTNEGCFCGEEIYNRKCTEEDLKKGCKSLDAISPKNYTIINSKHICIKKSDKKYIDYLRNGQIKLKNSSCPINYKSCGIVDTLERILCVKTDENCPLNINDIMNNLDSSFEYNSFPIGYNNYKINISKDNNEKILSIFKLNQYFPCMYPDEKNWTYHYILEQPSKECKNEIKGNKTDFRYEKLTKYISTKYQLYKDNLILDNLVNYNENILKNEEVYLYGRYLLGFNIDEIDGFSYEKIISSQSLINKSKKILKIFTYIIIGGISFGLLSLIIALCNSTGGIHNLFFMNIIVPCFLVIISFIGIILSLILIGIFILSIIIFIGSARINSLLNISGSDEYTNEFIQNLIKECSKNYYFSLSIMIIFPFLLFLIILLLYFIFKK